MTGFSPVLNRKWDNRLAFDVALRLEGSGEEMDTILSKHGIDALRMSAIAADPVFQKQVATYRADISENGITFRMKARTQAEELLMTSWALIHSEEVSAAVKADLIKSTVKWAGLEPKGDITSDSGASGGVKITINLGNDSVEATVIDHAASEEHGED